MKPDIWTWVPLTIAGTTNVIILAQHTHSVADTFTAIVLLFIGIAFGFNLGIAFGHKQLRAAAKFRDAMDKWDEARRP